MLWQIRELKGCGFCLTQWVDGPVNVSECFSKQALLLRLKFWLFKLKIQEQSLQLFLQLLFFDNKLTIARDHRFHFSFIVKAKDNHLCDSLRLSLQPLHPRLYHVQLLFRLFTSQADPSIIEIDLDRVEFRVHSLDPFMNNVYVVLFDDVLDLINPFLESLYRDWTINLK